MAWQAGVRFQHRRRRSRIHRHKKRGLPTRVWVFALRATPHGLGLGLSHADYNLALPHLLGHAQRRRLRRVLIIDGFVKSPKFVMPDLIPAEDGIFDRHPESTEITGFLPDLIRDLPE